MAKGRKTGGKIPSPIHERFWAKVNKTETCWLWTGAKIGKGYGMFWIGPTLRSEHFSVAHRYAYQLLVGPIPHKKQLDHLCRVKLCVNPKHLEPVTNRENCMRGIRARKG